MTFFGEREFFYAGDLGRSLIRRPPCRALVPRPGLSGWAASVKVREKNARGGPDAGPPLGLTVREARSGARNASAEAVFGGSLRPSAQRSSGWHGNWQGKQFPRQPVEGTFAGKFPLVFVFPVFS